MGNNKLKGINLKHTLPLAQALAIIDMVLTSAARHDISLKISHAANHRTFNIVAYNQNAQRLKNALPDLTVMFDQEPPRATISITY